MREKRIPSYEKRVHKITVRLNSFEFRALRRYCMKNHCSMSSALRTGLDWLDFKTRKGL